MDKGGCVSNRCICYPGIPVFMTPGIANLPGDEAYYYPVYPILLAGMTKWSCYTRVTFRGTRPGKMECLALSRDGQMKKRWFLTWNPGTYYTGAGSFAHFQVTLKDLMLGCSSPGIPLFTTGMGMTTILDIDTRARPNLQSYA